MSDTPLIEFIGVHKSFGDVRANRDLNLRIRAGSIHGIIGENGAGKSTAMKMLFGLYHPDQGEIRLRGKAIEFRNPTDAMNAGIGMVHQHFMLGKPFTALDNLLLTEDGPAWQILKRRDRRQHYVTLAERAGLSLDLDSNVEDLSVGAQQRIEILKVLARQTQVIILDEPTAVLTPQESRDLFRQLRALRDEGRTIIIITHKLREILEVTDEVSVLRAGHSVSGRKTSQTNAEELAELMIGRKDPQLQVGASGKAGETLIEFKNFGLRQGTKQIQNVNLSLRRGEIVGLAGVEGNGQDLLIKSLAEGGRHWPSQFEGDILFHGQSIRNKGAADLRLQGAAFFPEDRYRDGMMAQRPAWENFLLGQNHRAEYRRGPFLQIQKIKQACQSAMNLFGVNPRDPELKLGGFSGGNQQKFVVARELGPQPDVILAAHPTRGVDIGAIRFIHEKLLEARDRGAAILLVSSELEELMQLCDRIEVMYHGQIQSRFPRGQYDETRLGLAMGGHT